MLPRLQEIAASVRRARTAIVKASGIADRRSASSSYPVFDRVTVCSMQEQEPASPSRCRSHGWGSRTRHWRRHLLRNAARSACRTVTIRADQRRIRPGRCDLADPVCVRDGRRITCATGLLYMDVSSALGEWRRLLQDGGLLAFSTIAAGSPPGGRLFRRCAADLGVFLQDPCEPLGSSVASRAALEEAGFEVVAINSRSHHALAGRYGEGLAVQLAIARVCRHQAPVSGGSPRPRTPLSRGTRGARTSPSRRVGTRGHPVRDRPTVIGPMDASPPFVPRLPPHAARRHPPPRRPARHGRRRSLHRPRQAAPPSTRAAPQSCQLVPERVADSSHIAAHPVRESCGMQSDISRAKPAENAALRLASLSHDRLGMEFLLLPPEEARSWLRGEPGDRGFATNRFWTTARALAFIDALYAAGATEVLVDNIRVDSEGIPYADTLLIRFSERGRRAVAVGALLRRRGPGRCSAG